MTILSEDEFRRIETEWSGWPEVRGDDADVPALVASHRLLAERVRDLEGMLLDSSAALAKTTEVENGLLVQVARLKEALNHAEAFIRETDHGDNCFLHDEGEFSTCRCGKDGALDAVTDALSSPTGGDR